MFQWYSSGWKHQHIIREQFCWQNGYLVMFLSTNNQHGIVIYLSISLAISKVYGNGHVMRACSCVPFTLIHSSLVNWSLDWAIKAYYLHDWGQWRFLAKVNYCKNSSIYHVLTWSQLRPDMHQAFMVHGDYTKYE